MFVLRRCLQKMSAYTLIGRHDLGSTPLRTETEMRRAFQALCLQHPLEPLPSIGNDGLTLGRGTVLSRCPPDRAGRDLCAFDSARIAVLLAATYGRATNPIVLKQVARAAARWRAGEPALAQFELAFARLPRLETDAGAYRLFLAQQLIAGGMTPSQLSRALGFDDDLTKYDPNQRRNPAGSGAESGRWTKGLVTLATASIALAARAPSLVEALSPGALGWLTTLASRLSTPTAVFGALFIPSPNPSIVTEGAFPGRSDLSYRIDHDTGVLRLTRTDDQHPTHAVVAQVGPDGVYRDVETRLPIARILGQGATLIDLDRAPTAMGESAERTDQPKLCPAPTPDWPGGRLLFDEMYQQYVRDQINPQRRPQLPSDLGFRLPANTKSGFVHYDDCRESDGTMIDAKGNYKEQMSSDFMKKQLGEDWVFQAQKQVLAAAAVGRRVEWYFHDPEAEAFAKDLFDKNEIDVKTFVLPHPLGVPNPNPRVR